MRTTLPLEAHSPESFGLRTSLLNWVVLRGLSDLQAENMQRISQDGAVWLLLESSAVPVLGKVSGFSLLVLSRIP